MVQRGSDGPNLSQDPKNRLYSGGYLAYPSTYQLLWKFGSRSSRQLRVMRYYQSLSSTHTGAYCSLSFQYCPGQGNCRHNHQSLKRGCADIDESNPRCDEAF